MSEAIELEDYWSDIRRSSKRRPHRLQTDWKPPSLACVQNWRRQLASDGPRILAVEGPTSVLRGEVYGLCQAGSQSDDAWLVKGVQSHFVDQLSMLLDASESWGLLWGIIDVDELILDEPLLGLVDQGFRFTEVFQALWEARFLLSEGRDVRPLMQALADWLSMRPLEPDQQELLVRSKVTQELSTPQEQLDILLFLVALARQNDVLKDAIAVFDGLDRALKQDPPTRKKLFRELLGLVATVERWGRLGSPLGLAIGYHEEGGTLDSLKRVNVKLWRKIESGRCTP